MQGDRTVLIANWVSIVLPVMWHIWKLEVGQHTDGARTALREGGWRALAQEVMVHVCGLPTMITQPEHVVIGTTTCIIVVLQRVANRATPPQHVDDVQWRQGFRQELSECFSAAVVYCLHKLPYTTVFAHEPTKGGAHGREAKVALLAGTVGALSGFWWMLQNCGKVCQPPPTVVVRLQTSASCALCCCCADQYSCQPWVVRLPPASVVVVAVVTTRVMSGQGRACLCRCC